MPINGAWESLSLRRNSTFDNALDPLYTGKYDECCAMLRAVELYQFFTVNKSSVTTGKTAHAAPQSIVLHSKKPVWNQELLDGSGK
ncbi:hypothetical protein [Pseudomonas fluorescens]|uniref:hypothetical protein n=1 Tax=Pseudomonas fluorescens TaxID=294 RepID=UPI0012404532|nr:hypothetical protein [Pseudomonas fluorescens]